MTTESAPEKKIVVATPFWDGLGIFLSGACLIHCLAMPFLATFLTIWGLDVFLHESFHQILAGMLIFTSLLAFVPGYFKHKKKIVFHWMMPGLGAFLFSTFFLHHFELHTWELPLNILGGICLITAHTLNHTFCRACSKCCP